MRALLFYYFIVYSDSIRFKSNQIKLARREERAGEDGAQEGGRGGGGTNGGRGGPGAARRPALPRNGALQGGLTLHDAGHHRGE